MHQIAAHPQLPLRFVHELSRHPAEVLRSELADVWLAAPASIKPMEIPVREPQFFPGASGLLDSLDWNDVVPCARPAGPPFPPWRPGGVLVVAHNFSSADKYDEICSRERDTHLAASWNGLKQILIEANIGPSEVFLTNAILGAPRDLANGDQGAVKVPDAYRDCCVAFLAREMTLFAPSVVLAFGSVATEYVGRAVLRLCHSDDVKSSGAIMSWADSSTFTFLDNVDAAVVQVFEPDMTLVALTHFSRGKGNSHHRKYDGISGWAAEVKMIQAARSPRPPR